MQESDGDKVRREGFGLFASDDLDKLDTADVGKMLFEYHLKRVRNRQIIQRAMEGRSRADKGTFPLLNLPPELRFEIYECAITPPARVYVIEFDRTEFPNTLRSWKWQSLHEHSTHPNTAQSLQVSVGLLRTCQFINHEATAYLYPASLKLRCWFNHALLLLEFLQKVPQARQRIVAIRVDSFRALIRDPSECEDMKQFFELLAETKVQSLSLLGDWGGHNLTTTRVASKHVTFYTELAVASQNAAIKSLLEKLAERFQGRLQQLRRREADLE